MSKTVATSSSNDMPKTYEELFLEYLPQPIVDNVHYKNTLIMIENLMTIEDETEDQGKFLNLLVVLVEAYEQEHHAIDTSDLSPLDVLHHLMKQHDMNAKQLGELLGDRTLGGRVLKGERNLSTKFIGILSKHFNVSTDLFF